MHFVWIRYSRLVSNAYNMSGHCCSIRSPARAGCQHSRPSHSRSHRLSPKLSGIRVPNFRLTRTSRIFLNESAHDSRITHSIPRSEFHLIPPSTPFVRLSVQPSVAHWWSAEVQLKVLHDRRALFARRKSQSNLCDVTSLRHTRPSTATADDHSILSRPISLRTVSSCPVRPMREGK